MVLPDLSHIPLDEQQRLRQSAAAEPPRGVLQNLENPPNETNAYRGFLIFCIVSTIAFSLGRFYGTWYSSRKWFFSDAMFLVALAAYFPYMGFALDSVNKVGYLMHQWDVTLDDMLYMLYSLTICPILFAIVILFTKLAILMEWLRIFNPTGQRGYFWWLTAIMIGLAVTYYVAAVFLKSFACRPFAKSYDPFLAGDCLNIRLVYLLSAVINLVLDLGILVLPLQVIWKLQMTKEKKLGVGVVFTLGILAVLCATLRVPITIQWMKSADVLYETSVIGITLTAEMTCGFLVFCAPSLPKAFVGLGQSRLMPGIYTIISRAHRSKRISSDFSETDIYIKIREQSVSLRTIGGSGGGKFKSSKTPSDYSDARLYASRDRFSEVLKKPPAEY